MSVEDLLTRTLTEVAETTDHRSTPLSTVVARSRTIRSGRRRRVSLLAAAAVVAAGGLSAALMLGNGGDTTPSPAGPLGDLEQGAPPRVDYLDGNTFVSVSGDRVTSPTFAKAAAAVRWKKGGLVALRGGTSRHPSSSISFVSGGTTSRIGCGPPSFAVPAGGGDPVYWLAAGCRLDRPVINGTLVQGDTRTDTDAGATFTPVGLTADGVVTFSSSSGLELPSHALVIPTGHQDAIPLRLAIPRAATEAGGLVAGEARDFRRSAVVGARTGSVRWQTPPSWILERFSASGRYVAGTQSVGVQPSSDVGDIVGIFDAETGHLLLQKTLPGLVLAGQPVWEGDDAVLVVAEDRSGREAVVRVGMDGTVTRATGALQDQPPRTTGRPPLPLLRLASTP